MRSSVTALFVFICALFCPLQCNGWQYGPMYSYPCDLTNGLAWGHYSNGLTNYIWPAQDINNKFSIIPSSNTYRSAHNVTFTIASTYGMTLKGFMLQAFDKHDKRVGTWALASPSGVQPSTAALSVSTAMCATNHSNTLVHGISLAVTGFSAVWIPPPHCCTGEVRVNVMIMQLYNIYWVWNINLHEDNSTMAPEPVQSLQIGDSWTNNDNSASATITWMPPLLAGGGGNTTVKVSAYIMTVYLGNTKVQTITINGTHAIASEVTGFVSGTINGLLAYTNYTVSVAAQSIVSKQVATQNLGANVAAGVVLTGTVTNVTLLTPKVTALYISPLPPANVSITYKIVPTTNNVASQLNYTGVGSGVTATITYQLNNTVMSSLQNLGIYVRYYPVNDPGNIITYSPPTNPVAVKGIYTITIPFLLPSTEYEFGLELHTSGQGYASTDIISPGITPGCLNSCSGVGYCHPQLVMCHCPIDYLGPDCSIPVRFWDCEFSKPYDSLCITWSIQHLNVSTNGGEIYMRVRGPIDGGFFSVLFGVWLQDGMHNGEGFNIWVNPLTNETAMGAPKGQPELRPNHAQKITADGFIGYYNNDDSSSDLTWWFQVVNAANSGNQFPFYNLTAGIGQQYNASWCRGPGINGGHDVFHRGKMYMSIADYWIQKVGDDPDYVVSFMPFYIITSIFVVLAAIYQFIAGASPPQSYSKGKGKSHSVSAPNNELQSLVLSVSSALHASILPSSLSQYFLLPANHLSQKIKNPVLKFITLWSIRLWDLVTFNIRRAIGEMLGLDLMLVGLYFLIVLTFLLTMIHQYNNIQYGLDAKTAYGYIIFWHMTLMFLPISKHSLILYLFRIPFERAIKYHRWISRMTIVWIAVHFATESSIYYSKIANIQLTSIAIPTLWDYISMTDTTQYGYGHLYGFISGVLALAIFVSSLTVVRRYFFTMFYLSHILLFPAFVVIAALHHFYVLYFAVPPLGLWVLDHVIRWVRILLHSSRAMNIKFWRVATSKKVRQTIRMDLAAKSMKTRPGQYAFICVPSLSFMWHPYSISTSQSSVQLRKDGELTIVDNDKLSFHILGMGGLTFSERLVNLGRKLHHHDSDAPAKLPLVLVDGPYGELSVDIEQYSNLVIVAGGIGVTAFIGLLNDLMVQHLHRSPRKVSLQHIRFIWITRDSSSFHHWCSELLDALFALPAFANVQLFETDSIQEEEYGFENGSTKDLLKDVRSSSQLLPVDEQNQRKTLETPYKESTLKALKSLDDVKTHELQRLSPPQVTHHQEQSVELTHVMFHINSAALTDEISVKRTSLKNRENDFSHDENEMKYADQEKVETELKVAAAADVGSTTSNISTRTTTELISVPPNSPPSSPRGKPSPRYPITRARPDWNTVFAEADNAFLADGTAKNNTAVLVCGPQGLVAAVHEQASQRNWPLHKEFFYI